MLPKMTRPINQDPHANIAAPGPSLEFMRERIPAMLRAVTANQVEFVYWFLLKAMT